MATPFRMVDYQSGSSAQTKCLYALLPDLEAALPYLASCVQQEALRHGSQQLRVRIADYGAALGQQSLPVIERTIQYLRQSLAPATSGEGAARNDSGRVFEVEVHLCDLPDNDWTAAFKLVLNAENPGYAPRTQTAPRVYVYGCGTSHFDQIHPDRSVHFAFSSTALHWLSRLPCRLAGKTIFANQYTASPTEREAFLRQSTEDWQRLLRLRSRELAPGGVAVLFLMVEAECIRQRADALSDALESLTSDGWITEEEEAAVSMQHFLPPEAMLLAPFQKAPGAPTTAFAGLELIARRQVEVNDLATDTGTPAEEVATKVTKFLRTVVEHTFRTALQGGGRQPVEIAAAVDELFQRCHANLVTSPPTVLRNAMLALTLRRCASSEINEDE